MYWLLYYVSALQLKSLLTQRCLHGVETGQVPPPVADNQSMPQVNTTSTTHNDQFVTHELSLGTRLNQAIHGQQRADFSYLLALLSTDPLEQAVNLLEREAAPEAEWSPPFDYTSGRPLQAQSADYQAAPGAAWQRSRVLWRLLDALRPEGLNPRDDVKAIDPDVFNNCPHYVRQRLQAQTPAAKEWQTETADLLDVIEQVRGAGH